MTPRSISPAAPDGGRRRAAPVATGPEALRRLRAGAPPGWVEGVLGRVGLRPPDHFVLVPGPAGELFVAFNDEGISAVDLAARHGGDPARFAAAHRRATGRPARGAARPPAGLAAALRSGRGAGLRYDLAALTPFERAVLAATLEIPPGEVRPYGWVAGRIGRPRAVRAVGSALGRNPVPVLIPCHRVVRTDGQVGNYGLGPPVKRALLSAEGLDLDRLERLASAGTRFVGSATTGVFCVPSCTHARRITPAHEVAFRSSASAESAGFRPCTRCLPTAAAAS